MFSPKRRITKSLFAKIVSDGRNFNSKSVSLRVVKREDVGNSAFSFVVGAKQAKKAADRNLLKRRGRYTLQKHYKNLKDGYLCAFFFRKEALSLSYSELEQEILHSLKLANLLK